jgi:hypothetical protein
LEAHARLVQEARRGLNDTRRITQKGVFGRLFAFRPCGSYVRSYVPEAYA